MKSISKFKILLLALLTVVTIYIIYALVKAPKLKYNIITLTDGEETPMQLLLSQDEKGIDFNLRFKDKPGAVAVASLMKEIKYQYLPPFLRFGNNLEVKLQSGVVDEQGQLVLFEIDGSITNLNPGAYRLRILDANNNLIDEKLFDINRY